ncbi:MAG: hypothetical protein KJN89_03825 [Gammaproteobacteria bacterium]|nr:hypothetical protein [Gammaproteobacteria bacterium]NNJ49480.1 hypothetical protein [Gammaproteobacteria bacterium]
MLLAWAFWASCLSVRAFQRVRVLAQHDNGTASMGTPAFQGRSLRGGLFWVLFWAVAKEYLARGASTARPE